MELIRNDKTGEYGLWDGQNVTPVIRNDKTGEYAAWDGTNLSPLPPEIRRPLYRQTVKDPGFQGLQPEQRHRIAREILFPASEYPEREREARPKATAGKMFTGGLERIGKGIRGEGAESIFAGRGLEVPATNIVEGALEVAAAPPCSCGQSRNPRRRAYLGLSDRKGVRARW